jgi:hypothetical protein
VDLGFFVYVRREKSDLEGFRAREKREMDTENV